MKLQASFYDPPNQSYGKLYINLHYYYRHQNFLPRTAPWPLPVYSRTSFLRSLTQVLAYNTDGFLGTSASERIAAQYATADRNFVAYNNILS